MQLSDAMWRQKLGEERYAVCRCAATEAPFSGAYWDHHEDGVYHCAACQVPLFDSTAKYDSGTGWPSFDRAAGAVAEQEDRRHGMVRLEILCAGCRSHLGHVFEDSSTATHRRFCVNSLSLQFAGRHTNEER